LHEVVCECLAARGAGQLDSQLDSLSEQWPVAQDSAHHMGTTRMHLDPRQGVTDPHGRVHEVQNLFVSGSSLLPTSGYANPTLTIIGLAIHLADHLKLVCATVNAIIAARADISAPAKIAARAETSLGRVQSG
jgi:choline dehydrogenase-like flavoprotein